VYSNLAKDQRDIAAANARYRISRQTIFCSATIPQRLDDFLLLFIFLFIFLFIYFFIFLFFYFFIFLFFYLCIDIRYLHSHSFMSEMIFFHCIVVFQYIIE
jgi:hypothetical protein